MGLNNGDAHLFMPAAQPVGDPFDILRLIRSRRVGPATFHRLIAEHGSACAALSALPAIAKAAGVADYAICPPAVIKAELAAGRRAGARLVVWGGPDYPKVLSDIPDAPPALWLLGNADLLEMPQIGIVGARNASSLGLRMAAMIAEGLGQAGLGVTAGLARGIDTAAHKAALSTGTIAVMAGGIDRIYPAENTALAGLIAQSGLLVSEQPPGTQPTVRHFPTRNRILSGLCRAVVVVEAAHRSGSLITAKNALDQGREVLAVPGHPLDARASGCNALIRDGATLVRQASDVLAALDITPKTPATSKEYRPELPHAEKPHPCVTPPHADQLARRVLEKLGPHPTDENLLIRDLGLSAATLAPVILSLELAGRVERLAGGALALV